MSVTKFWLWTRLYDAKGFTYALLLLLRHITIFLLPQNFFINVYFIIVICNPSLLSICHIFDSLKFTLLFVTAPPGHIIKLDFRDWFQIEPSPGCKNDALEVRDGSYGFDRLLDKAPYCGSQFPPELTSTDRNLWIHFESDENIEYKGFKAVYKYSPRPPNCKYRLVISVLPLYQLNHTKKPNLNPSVFSHLL